MDTGATDLRLHSYRCAAPGTQATEEPVLGAQAAGVTSTVPIWLSQGSSDWKRPLLPDPLKCQLPTPCLPLLVTYDY